MVTVAITGGIASGKTTVCQALAEALEAPWLSCDAVVHELYADPEVLARVREEFGDGVFHPDGRPESPRLGKNGLFHR